MRLASDSMRFRNDTVINGHDTLVTRHEQELITTCSQEPHSVIILRDDTIFDLSPELRYEKVEELRMTSCESLSLWGRTGKEHISSSGEDVRITSATIDTNFEPSLREEEREAGDQDLLDHETLDVSGKPLQGLRGLPPVGKGLLEGALVQGQWEKA